MEFENITIEELLKAGVHFGHRTRYCNTSMKPYIYGVKNKIHIIDIVKTLQALKNMNELFFKGAERGAKFLFVGTKKSAEILVKNYAKSCGQHYVNKRWLGGTLTNWKTVKKSIKKMKDLLKQQSSGQFDILPKKEQITKIKLLKKLDARFGGLINLGGLPDYLFVIDAQKERIALKEAKKVGVTTIAVLDTNVSTEYVDYIIPGNDDAISAINKYLSIAENAIEKGKEARRNHVKVQKNEESKNETQSEVL